MFDHIPYKDQPHWLPPVVRAASQHRVLLELDYRPLIRIQLELLDINKIRTLERIMLCEFQMDCDDADPCCLWLWAAVRGEQAGQPCFPRGS